MNETAASLDTPKDAGEGPSGVHRRWMLALDLASREEEDWRKAGQSVVDTYRDEQEYKPNQRKGTSRFNILWSNVEIMRPSLYSNTPRPDVRRRYRDADPIGKEVAETIERALMYSIDAYDFDHVMELAVLDYLLPGRAVTRIRYNPTYSGEGEAREVVDEAVVCEPVPWRRFRRGPALTWNDVPWIAFEHLLTRDELKDKFGAIGGKIPLDVEIKGTEDKEEESSIFRRGRVWEIWDKDTRQVIYIAPEHKDGPIKTEDDPLQLRRFFPIPRPLYAVETSDSLVPIEEYRLYRDQAEELDQITHRIRRVVSAIKARGIYDATLSEMSRILESDDNELIPSEGAQNILAQTGTLERHIWMLPVDKLGQVLAVLYEQREAIKQTIYEITGLSDILRGATNAQETLGAQQLKAQTGSLRLQRRQRDVQRYARDILEIKAEIMVEQFDPATLSAMTGKQILPEMVELVRNERLREYRIDIETDSTIAADQQADAENITKLLTGITQYMEGVGPAVMSGMLPKDAAVSLLVSAVRRFKMGREVEDKLEGMLEQQPQQGPTQEEIAQMQEQIRAQVEQEMQAERETVKAEATKVQAERTGLQTQQQTAQQGVAMERKSLEVERARFDLDKQAATLEVKAMLQDLEKRTAALETLEQRVQMVIDKAEMRGSEVEGREGEAEERETKLSDAGKQIQEMVEGIAKLAEAIGKQSEDNEVQKQMLAALTAPKELVRDAQGRPVGVRTKLNG